MPVGLSKKPVISREALQELGDARLREAGTLLEAGHYTGAVYLGGYAVECYLKAAICFTLGWDALLETFKTHQLEELMLYSGFERRLRETAGVHESFAKIMEIWSVEMRYRRPVEFSKEQASTFLGYAGDAESGVVPWLRSMIC